MVKAVKTIVATYLTFDKFKLATVMPDEFVTEVEQRYPGWVEGQLEFWSRWIDARLRKLYASPFAAHDVVPIEEATPPQIQIWLAQIVAVEIWLKRGVDLNDKQFDKIDARATLAKDEIKEAANSEDNWFDLPKRTDADGSLLAKATPLVYSEQSPYVWTDRQRATGILEDDSQTGTGD